MNIGFFTDTYFPQVSGVSTSVKLLRDELVRQGHEVIIFTTTDPNARPEPGVVRLPSVPFVSFEDRRVAYSGFERCLKIARNYQLDLVHTHTEFSLGLAGRYVASRLKIPTIHTYHTMYENYTHYILNGKLIRPGTVKVLSKVFCDQGNGVIAPSLMTKDTLTSYGIKAPIRVIPTGVEIPDYNPEGRDSLRQKLGLSQDDIVLLSLSRLSKEKNIAAVSEVYPRVLDKLPQAKLVIVGEGPERPVLEQQAKDLGIKPIFVGEVEHSQVSAYYQMADLYINASMSESQGLTYLEAFANRLPIIAKRNDYLAGIMTNDNFGALFDDFEDFDRAILDYLAKMEAGLRPNIDRQLLYPLSLEHFEQQVADFYQEVIKQNKRRKRSSGLNKIVAGVKYRYKQLMGG